MVRTSPPRPSNPVLRSTSSGHSVEDGSFRTPARAAALPIRKGVPSPVRTGQPRRLESTSSRSSQPKHHTPSRFPVRAPRTRPEEESGSPASRARRCQGVGLHSFHCIFHGTNIILSLVVHSLIDKPTRKKSQRAHGDDKDVH